MTCTADKKSDNPKQRYFCDFPGCERNFVRADLRARHKERHTAKGSHLQRKDAFLNSQRPNATVSGAASPSSTATMPAVEPNHGFQSTTPTTDGYMHATPYTSASDQLSNNAMVDLTHLTTPNGLQLDPQLGPYTAYPGSMNGPQQHMMPPSGTPDSRRSFSYDGSFAARPAPHVGGYNQHQSFSMNSMQPPPPMTSPQSAGPVFAQQPYPSPTSTNRNFQSPSNYSSVPSYGYQQSYGPTSSARSGSVMSSTTINAIDQHPVPNSRANSVDDFNVIDQMNTGYAMPVFGVEPTFARSPPPMFDETFLNMLFSTNGLEPNDPSPPEQMKGTPEQQDGPLPKLEPDGTTSDPFWPSFDNGLDINKPESMISESKQRRLVGVVKSFSEIAHNPGRRTKVEIVGGNVNDPSHVMSLQMLKTYVASYWLHIHRQMPILHQPTFNPETCPDPLLLAIVCLGATSLERIHSLEVSKSSAELAFFVAYHIRWEVFKDAEFRPTAKLWTFQSMLLLELFEKMYSTRSLHERAHIHHATTLTVMRRGSSLIGRSAEPSGTDDPTRTPPGPENSINTSGQNTPDAIWNVWITQEATRRAAFAAFIIDSTHATLFGHMAVMSPHDMRLPLPCDESLWSAASMAEVSRVEASLAANGFRSTTFLEGLKRTLNGQKVRTNTFGRVILMAGLLNVSWHMNQRDLQVLSLGAANTLGNQIKWRLPLTKAFDFWRRDFDDSLDKNEHWMRVSNSKNNDRNSIDYRDSVFESRTCLHSLAHMAMHVDIIDCQVFAGADRALGRLVTESDRAAVQRRMRDHWAPSAKARDATYYALRFLCEVLIPEEEEASRRLHPHLPPTFSYSARDDYLLNRPWVLYFAALIVWSYGYALDGPIRPSNYILEERHLRILDMQRYLNRIGKLRSPDDLAEQRDRNSCLGLLLLLREKFEEPRWELLHEARDTLSSCIELLLPDNTKVRQ